MLVAVGLVALAPLALCAANTESSGDAAGMSASPRGMILRRPAAADMKGKWFVVGDKEALPAEQLLVGLPGAEVDSANGAVRLNLKTDLDSPLPILEPAVVLHKADGRDLDFTLDRGMVEVVNTKKKGEAVVRVTIKGVAFDLTLYAPGVKAALVLAARWPKGAPFKKTPGPKDVPAAHLLIFAEKGEVDVRHDGRLFAMEAPPGAALLEWDNFHGLDVTPQRLEALPAWILPPTDPAEIEKERKLAENVSAFAKAVADKPLETVLDEFVTSDDKSKRHFAIVVLGAIDHLKRLGDELSGTKYPDLWDATVVVLRNWIGRAPGNDQILYQRLIDIRGYKPKEAETVLHFLHTPEDVELTRPETYEMLIDFLESDRLSIRGLAFWHLYRLVPEGRKIAYDPLAAKEERAKARAEWKKLIPDGKLPPKPVKAPQEKEDK